MPPEKLKNLKEAVWDYCRESALEESWSRDELYEIIDKHV